MGANSATNLFLIGPTGAGKTSVGRCLAARLGQPFLDLDHEIEQHCGASISQVFEREGEAGFRKREAEMLACLVMRHGIVLACGAGAVLAPDNRERLRRHGQVIWLDCPPEVQLARLAGDQQRPLLAEEDRRSQLLRMASERTALYRETAHLRVPSGRGDQVTDVASAVLLARSRAQPGYEGLGHEH